MESRKGLIPYHLAGIRVGAKSLFWRSLNLGHSHPKKGIRFLRTCIDALLFGTEKLNNPGRFFDIFLSTYLPFQRERTLAYDRFFPTGLYWKDVPIRSIEPCQNFEHFAIGLSFFSAMIFHAAFWENNGCWVGNHGYLFYVFFCVILSTSGFVNHQFRVLRCFEMEVLSWEFKDTPPMPYQGIVRHHDLLIIP